MNGEAVVARFAEPLYRAKGWMTFGGVLLILQGVFSLVGIWTIIFAWIPVWMGILLCSASSHIRTAFETNNEDEFRTSMTKLGTYFRILGIFGIVMIVIALIGLLAAIAIPSFVAARNAAMAQ